jgi:hypothetical protein
MATQAYSTGKKLYWDRQREEIVDPPPALLLEDKSYEKK